MTDIVQRLIASSCHDDCLLAKAAKEIASLREQVENCTILMARIENERNACLEELHAISEALGTNEGHSSVYWIEQLKAALKTDQEPVAWRYRPNEHYGWMFVELMPQDTINYVSEPLYTHPARTLSDEEILEIARIKLVWQLWLKDEEEVRAVIAFARAVLEASK